ncbi:hypothetical protein TYRP_017057 [Tyrophagus putrescentiae]|nr:hypothetical protein TYRP_017057 [Tyrophagus putrescentiae]
MPATELASQLAASWRATTRMLNSEYRELTYSVASSTAGLRTSKSTGSSFCVDISTRRTISDLFSERSRARWAALSRVRSAPSKLFFCWPRLVLPLPPPPLLFPFPFPPVYAWALAVVDKVVRVVIKKKKKKKKVVVVK